MSGDFNVAAMVYEMIGERRDLQKRFAEFPNVLYVSDRLRKALKDERGAIYNKFLGAELRLKSAEEMRKDPRDWSFGFDGSAYRAEQAAARPTGWECPRCHTINAPWVAKCGCAA